ncbi:uncharacterized protein LOC110023565 [Phalaenopsis equestris]|uniref:uncharacterized protein LOC110023565 n=1 Tax=Phalaenopsis equestris TaxID=78828 RepID=UPI0009E26B85|nr:uncharacterized protein LOC110023565 [Phalaenopsis equestris]
MAPPPSPSPNVLLLLLFTANLIPTSLPSTTQGNIYLLQTQFMPAGFSINYQGRYIFEMRRDCNAYFRDTTLPNPIWQTNINYNGAKDRCRLKIRRNCKIVILSDFRGTELWWSDSQQAVDTACFIQVTENLVLYKADRTMLWVNGNKAGTVNFTGANSRL